MVGGTEMTAEFDLGTTSRSDTRVTNQTTVVSQKLKSIKAPQCLLHSTLNFAKTLFEWSWWLYRVVPRCKYIKKRKHLVKYSTFCLDLIAGKTHTLFFKSVRPEHAGEIRFTAERVSSYAALTVKGELPDCLCHNLTHFFRRK